MHVAVGVPIRGMYFVCITVLSESYDKSLVIAVNSSATTAGTGTGTGTRRSRRQRNRRLRMCSLSSTVGGIRLIKDVNLHLALRNIPPVQRAVK